MKSFIPNAIRVFAFLLFIVGIILLIVGIIKGNDAGRGYYSRNETAMFIWYGVSLNAFVTVIASVFVYGFSYIVEASCKYLEKCEAEEYNDSVSASED